LTLKLANATIEQNFLQCLMSADQQKIGVFRLTSLVTGNLIGAGVFLLPASLAVFGSISLWGWVIASFGAILLALVFSNLSQMLPKIGGPYVYVQKAFGKHIGFYLCWGYWVMAWVSNSSLLAGAVGYASQIYGGFDKETSLMLELAILFSITILNLFGLKMTGSMGFVFTVLKVIPLILLPIFGLAYVDLNNLKVFNATAESTLSTLNLVAFITFWGFIGIETGTVPGGQVINPRRTIPIATIIGTLIAAVVYMLGTFVIMGIMPLEALRDSRAPYADVAEYMWGGSWSLPIAIAAIISCIGSLNGWTMIVGRMPQAAADDGLFPSMFSRVNSLGSPYNGIIVSSVLTVPLLFMSISDQLLEQFNFIMEISTTLILIIYLVCVLAYIKIL
jgi:basic amino acid/polyamine antiporter, APA family